jgi:hypothetical protein
MKEDTMRRIAALDPLAPWLVALALTAAGCASSGPGVIPRDRVNSQEALSGSSKTQTLLNVVRIRYADPPLFLEVASIVNSYAWEAGASVGTASGDASLYSLVFGILPSDDGESTILTRSMLEIVSELGSGIHVPAKDVEVQRVAPPPAFDGAPTLPPLLRVRCAAEVPGDASAAAQYRGQWFWIDDRDIPSKRVFGFLTLLFSLAETGGNPSLPVLTIPAG